MNNLEFLVFNFTFYFLGRSLLRVFKRDKNSDDEKIFETKIFIFYTLFGVLFVSATTFLLSFFLPLKQYKPYLIAIILLLLLLNIKDISVPKNKIFFLFNYLLTPLIIGFSSYNIKFHYDSYAYHLATQSWIINSKIVLSDSGTINEEASILDLKAINIRNSHERPEADEEAVTLLTGLDLERVSRAINYLTENRISKKNIVEDYNNKIVSIKLVKILMSHIGFVNENHYKK